MRKFCPCCFKIPYSVSTCHLCMQHNGCKGKLYFMTLPSAAHTNNTTSSNVYVQRNFNFYGFNIRKTNIRKTGTLDLHNLVFINPSLSVSVWLSESTFSITCVHFPKHNSIFMAQINILGQRKPITSNNIDNLTSTCGLSFLMY